MVKIVPKSVGNASDTSPVPVSEQATLRVPKELHEKLRVIAAMQSRYLFDVTTDVLRDYCNRWEAATGQSVKPSGKKRVGPKV